MTNEEEFELIRQASFDARVSGNIEKHFNKAVQEAASDTTYDILSDIAMLVEQLQIAKDNNRYHLTELGRLLKEKAQGRNIKL